MIVAAADGEWAFSVIAKRIFYVVVLCLWAAMLATALGVQDLQSALQRVVAMYAT